MKITIDVPWVPYRAAGRPSQSYYRTAARNLREDYPAGGSNVRNTIADLLDEVAKAMDEVAETEPDAWPTDLPNRLP